MDGGLWIIVVDIWLFLWFGKIWIIIINNGFVSEPQSVGFLICCCFLKWSIWLRNKYLCLCTYYNFKSSAADDADEDDDDDDDDDNNDDDDDDDDDDDGDGGKYIYL